MKNRWTLLLLLALLVLSFTIRVVPPYDTVFGSVWIKFTSIDAYWQMGQVDKLAPDFLYNATNKLFGEVRFPEMSFFHWLLSGIIWVIGLGSPTQQTIDTVAVYFPAVLGMLTVIPVYFLGRVMFGQVAGIVAAALIAILPGEWLGRSSLGFTDHHVAEVLFSTTALLFVVLAIKGERGGEKIIYGLLAGLFFSLYWLTWKGALLLGGVLAGYLVAYLIISYLIRRYKVKYLVSIIAVATVGLVVFGGRIISSLFAEGTALTTLELEPFTFRMAMGNFNVLLFLVPVILGILVYKTAKQGEANTILLLVWSVIMLVVMLEYRRFAYYFSVNVALLTGWFIWYTWHKLRKQDTLRVMVVSLICLVAIIPNVQQAIAKHRYHNPSDAWCSTLDWVRENTPQDSVILSWWDYGFWISRIGQRKAYVNPGQDPTGITNTAKLFLSTNGETSITHNYLILDHSITTGKFWAVALWAGLPEKEFYEWVHVQEGKYNRAQINFHQRYYETLIMRLYTGEDLSQYALVYQSDQKIRGVPEVKVFYKRKIIDGQ